MPKPSRPVPPNPAFQGEIKSPKQAVIFWERPWVLWVVLVLLAGSIVAVYSNSLRVPNHLDDLDSIGKNESIKKFSTALFPPRNSGVTVSGRPLLNLSLAINYSIHGTDVMGYHVGNILIHVAAALALLGVVRRTLRLPLLVEKYGQHATPLAFGVAALWALHPLQTESVTYIIQRAESLVGLCYLFTLYAFIRSLEKPSRFWPVATIVTCYLGMASKEVMATAPLVIFLFDRTFVSGTFAESWRRHRNLFLGMASSWLLLLVLVISSGGRGSSVGYAAVSAWDYALTQTSAVIRYLKLAFIPNDQVFDYGPTVEKTPSVLVTSTSLLLPLLATTVVALRKWPIAGFFGAVFFLILAPTSSIVPVATQTIAEHRMYLSLAALSAGAAFLCYRGMGKFTIWMLVPLAALLGIVSHERNKVYLTPRALWEDTVFKMPDNIRALNNLGTVYLDIDEIDGALKCFEGALELVPTFTVSKSNLGRALILKAVKNAGLDKVKGDLLMGVAMGAGAKELETLATNEMVQKGLNLMEYAVKADPTNSNYALCYGNALLLLRRAEEAVEWLAKAVAIDNNSHDAHFGLGNALAFLDRNDGAALHFNAALRLQENDSETLTNYGALLRRMGQVPESIAKLESALKLAPNNARIHSNLGVSLLEGGRVDDAIFQLKEALRLDPDIPQARYNLSNALAETGQPQEAITHLEALLRITPPTAELVSNLGVLYARVGRLNEAVRLMRQALELDPQYSPAQENLDKISAYINTHR
ncbi:MAG: tetratricopeptide repeat protein [Nibricoccus sp.]